MEIAIRNYGESMGTREIGKEIRKLIIDDSERTVIDFKDVDIISNLFSEEIFGKIVNENGLDFLLKKIKLINTNPEVTLMIKKAIKDRINISRKTT